MREGGGPERYFLGFSQFMTFYVIRYAPLSRNFRPETWRNLEFQIQYGRPHAQHWVKAVCYFIFLAT